MKAIETRYKGYRFRSRLEARWAVFFDALGIGWEYEKEGYDLGDAGWYLPDFWLPQNAGGMYVEIKPTSGGTDHEKKKCIALAEASEEPVLLFLGLPPLNYAETGLGWYGYFPADGYANGLPVTLCGCRECDCLWVASRGWGAMGPCSVQTCPNRGAQCDSTNRAAVLARSIRFERGESAEKQVASECQRIKSRSGSPQDRAFVAEAVARMLANPRPRHLYMTEEEQQEWMRTDDRH